MKRKLHILFIKIVIYLFLIYKNILNSNAQNSPNIIYILADDLGYGDVSVYNINGKINTPNIDRLANEGMRFTDAHTSSAVSSPTRYGILTGRYSWRSSLKAGVLTGTSKALIPISRTTVASMLQTKGYHTAYIGKWHLGWDWALKSNNIKLGAGWDLSDFNNIDFTKPIKNSPNDLGFDYAYGFSASLDMAPYVYVENRHATMIPDTVTVNTGKYSWWREGITSKDFVHIDVTPNVFARAINYINKESKQQKPFFLYLPIPAPHTPILPTQYWFGKSGLNPYADYVMMIDDYVGLLLKAIKEAGIEDNTLVIFASDNGCAPAAKVDELEAKGHFPSYVFRGYKADIYEGGHRVPFIVRWPDKVKKATVCDQTICLNDFMATCADIINYKLKDNEAEDSYSLMPLFEQKKLDGPLREATVHQSTDGSLAIRKGDWKLIMCAGSGGWSYPSPSAKDYKSIIYTLPEIQLYNLNTDIGEKTNLQSKYPEKVNELKTLLIKYIKEGRSTPGKPQQNDTINFIWKQIDFIK